MKKKIICFLFAFTMLFALCSCDGYYENLYEPPYNAIMYSKHNSWINPSFLADNKVSGAFYKNENYNEDDSSNKYYEDITSPKSRTFIIKEQETFDLIFSETDLEVNFDEEIIVLYIFADSEGYLKYYITNILMEEPKVTIYYKLERSDKKGATQPYQRCLIVKMDKVNVEEVEFIKER